MAEFSAVVAAARELLARDGEVGADGASRELAEKFGVKDSPYGRTERDIWEAFKAQVRRAFDKLAGEGECTKVRAHFAGPDGTNTPWPRWLTPAAWAAATAKYEAEDAQAQDTANRYEAIHGRLAALGILTAHPGHPPDRRRQPRLQSPHQWERLLDWAEDAYGGAWGVRPPHAPEPPS